VLDRAVVEHDRRFHGVATLQDGASECHRSLTPGRIFWLTSRYETGPLVVLEATVVGVPTVGTNVGHVAEWAPDAAVAVPTRDHESLASETARLLADDRRRRALAREAQRRALAQDADWTATRLESVYWEVTGASVKDLGR